MLYVPFSSILLHQAPDDQISQFYTIKWSKYTQKLQNTNHLPPATPSINFVIMFMKCFVNVSQMLNLQWFQLPLIHAINLLICSFVPKQQTSLPNTSFHQEYETRRLRNVDKYQANTSVINSIYLNDYLTDHHKDFSLKVLANHLS